jgi:hypothetical protein
VTHLALLHGDVVEFGDDAPELRPLEALAIADVAVRDADFSNCSLEGFKVHISVNLLTHGQLHDIVDDVRRVLVGVL